MNIGLCGPSCHSNQREKPDFEPAGRGNGETSGESGDNYTSLQQTCLLSHFLPLMISLASYILTTDTLILQTTIDLVLSLHCSGDHIPAARYFPAIPAVFPVASPRWVSLFHSCILGRAYCRRYCRVYILSLCLMF